MPTNNDVNVKFRKGDLSNVDSTSQDAGQLLFAKYTDTNIGVQGDIYFDFDNDTRIKLANDVDRARTLYSGSTNSNAVPGDWRANIDGITSLYDGLTIALRINNVSNSGIYNTLKINNLAPKLVWVRYNQRATTEIKQNSEIILTYRSYLGSSSIPNSGGPGTLTAGNYNDGWVLNSVTEKMHTLTLGDDYVYDGSEDISAPLGTVITLKTWSIT